MPRVVVKRDDSNLGEAAASCPVSAFKNNGSEHVIDPNVCIDCGVCQGIVAEGVILEDGEASDEDKDYNEKKSQEW